MNARRPSRAAARLRCVGCLRGCLWRRWCSGRRRDRPLCVPVGGGPPASRPRRELRSARRLEARPGPAAAHQHRGRSLRRASHRRCLRCCVVSARPRRRPPALRQVPLAPFGALRTGVTCVAACGSVRRLEARPGPATASSISHAIPSDVFHGLKCDRWNSADSALVWGRAKLELHAELREFPCPWSSLLLRGIALLG